MRIQWSQQGFRGFWPGPALLGLLFIFLGVLLYRKPELLAYFVAGIFILAGCALLGAAWGMRRWVTLRRIDRDWRTDEDDTPSTGFGG